jgi:hypothetical protein
MYCLSPPHPLGTGRSITWGRAARWLFVLACSLLLLLASAGTARASTALAHPASIDSLAPDGATAVEEFVSTTDAVQVLDTQPVRDSHPGEPADSRDLIDDDDDRDDDQIARGDSAPRSQFSVEEMLGLRRPSGVSEASLSPDGPTLATPFLTDSVRRL